MQARTINVAEDFSPYPGGRYRADGAFSGEEFRESILWPAVNEAGSREGRVTIILDGTAGYAASFLEEAFGGLVRNHPIIASRLLSVLDIKAHDPQYEIYKNLATKYIRDAQKKMSK